MTPTQASVAPTAIRTWVLPPSKSLRSSLALQMCQSEIKALQTKLNNSKRLLRSRSRKRKAREDKENSRSSNLESSSKEKRS